MTTVGVLGGTFDPVHVGHVAVGQQAQRALGLDAVRLVPSRVPPHRSGPRASGYHRFTMAALVALDQDSWTVSDAELRREGPSFSYDTLAGLAAEGLQPTQIFFLIGADAFAEIATWHRYPAVLDLAHFVVLARPGTALAALGDRVPDLAPRIIGLDAARHGETTGIVLVDAATPGVSSTDIRERAARREPLAGLVTEPVERYIRRHGLYGSGPHW
ncbi:MAG: nicotinate-nucleotide adenylyltransferase [Vicinamibacterales bacterium]